MPTSILSLTSGLVRLRKVAITITFAIMVSGSIANAQTYTILHAFSQVDGALPWAGVTLDAAGNLYGTTAYGGANNDSCVTPVGRGCGTIFKLTHKGSSWTLAQLYNFKGNGDSAYPASGLVFGPDGALYGTTQGGDPNTDTCSQNGCGSVFRLQPQASFCGAVNCRWIKTVLHSFSGGADGSIPGTGNIIFDATGNIYGTTAAGGAFGAGTVYQLTRSGQSWTESVLYNFTGQEDGGSPIGGVMFDHSGNLVGTTAYGGTANFGTIFRLTRAGNSWTETILHSFQDLEFGQTVDGAYPQAGLTIDAAGNLFGTTAYGPGSDNLGTIFVYAARTGFATLTEFPYQFGVQAPGPVAAMTFDSAGNLWGTQYCAASTSGAVFQETLQAPFYPANILHLFLGEDGNNPAGSVVLDASGNAYGTTISGGAHLSGVVWEITH